MGAQHLPALPHMRQQTGGSGGLLLLAQQVQDVAQGRPDGVDDLFPGVWAAQDFLAEFPGPLEGRTILPKGQGHGEIG